MQDLLTLALDLGTSRDFPLQSMPASGTPTAWDDADPSPFLITDTLATSVWAGTNEAVLLSPATAWRDPAAATFVISFSDADTATMKSGIYEVRTTATRSTRTFRIFRGRLALADGPGTAVPRPTYVDITDLRKVCGWIERLQGEGDVEGFLDQCADAREWLDENILRNYTGGWASLMGMHDVALNAWFGGSARKTLNHNLFIAQQLADNHLIVSPRIRKVCALYACSLVFLSNLTSGKDYLAMAAMYRHQANQLLVSTTAEIDTSGAGTTPNIPITFSSANVLFA